MSTPFICRQCIARLTRSRAGKSRSKGFQLHTQAASTSIQQPTWGFSGRRESPVNHHIADDYKVGESTLDSTPTPSRVQNEAAVEQKPRDFHLKKVVPRPRKDINRISKIRVTGSQDLKKKILGSLGNYDLVHRDLMTLYGLTHMDAKHAVSQLKRLLWGRDSMEEAGARLDLFLDWKKHFNEFSQIADGSLPTTKTDGHTSMEDLAHPARQELETVKDVWQRLDRGRRELLWPQMILSTFRSSPNTLPTLVQATFQSSWCPSYIVEDLVYLLFQAAEHVQNKKTSRQQAVELILFLFANSPPRYLVLDEKTIWKLVYSVHPSKLIEIYETLIKIEHPLQTDTSLHFARRLARESRYKLQAADIIRSLANMPGFNINSPAVASVCTTLLTVEDGDLPDDHAAPDELFKMLLEVGFRPNLLNLSALMQNFCVRGRVEVAWNIFDSLVQRGIEPDAHVFSTLINGSKRVLDAESLRHAVDMTEASKGWSPHLVNDLLGYIYRQNETRNEPRRRQKKMNTQSAWRLMVQIYTKFFKLAPLQKLTRFPLENLLVSGHHNRQLPAHLKRISQLTEALKPRADVLLMQPDSFTLTLMLSAHFRSINNPMRLQMYYKYFMKLLHKSDPTITKIIKDRGNTIRDIFIRDFMQFKPTLNAGIRMVQAMLANSKREEKKLGQHIFHPPPSVHTYTTLMNGLRNQGRFQGVITVLNMMIKEGVTPNIVTWNIVIGTLLRGGFIKEAVKVMRHMEQIGLQSNTRTIESVTRLSKSKKKRVALLMRKLAERPVNYADQRAFAESLLRIWQRKDDPDPEDQISMRRVRQIMRTLDPDGQLQTLSDHASGAS
ncbi:hypothetical protein M426DRAFT_134725 [Hypoxylon sp. CI-4A]|nr:hypothetical protein M426DRAFT_134725 [Hypoxylon sp. CI-4A]